MNNTQIEIERLKADVYLLRKHEIWVHNMFESLERKFTEIRQEVSHLKNLVLASSSNQSLNIIDDIISFDTLPVPDTDMDQTISMEKKRKNDDTTEEMDGSMPKKHKKNDGTTMESKETERLSAKQKHLRFRLKRMFDFAQWDGNVAIVSKKVVEEKNCDIKNPLSSMRKRLVSKGFVIKSVDAYWQISHTLITNKNWENVIFDF